MAYSELIKSFDRIRDYMRDFFVYGFRSRGEFDRKSARSYDNERRRVESWLGDYMSFRQDESGKSVFLSVDSRTVAHNPLYQAFQAKSFTAADVTLHFLLLDLLSGGEALSVRQIAERLSADYLSRFEDAAEPDESTVRNKLKEYESLGLLRSEKVGREVRYSLSPSGVDEDSWREAETFFSEADPLGVIGSYLLDRPGRTPDYFGFKHHYLLQALDSEVLSDLLAAMGESRAVEVTSFVPRRGDTRTHTVFPVKIYVSTQTGKLYLLSYHYRLHRPMFFRLDNVRKVTPGSVEMHPEKYSGFHDKLRQNLWGTSFGAMHSLDHVEMTVRVEEGEEYILDRLYREKRCGRVEPAGDGLYRFVADVFDAGELLPWLRTFIGRIVKLESTNAVVVRRFYEDLEAAARLYGGESDAVS
jgi:DNA-binding transcriptional ArsR family regulator